MPPRRAAVVRRRDRLGSADDLERVVTAATFGALADLFDGISRRGIDEIGRALLRRCLAFHRHRIHGEDARRAGNARALHDTLADPATTHHGHRRSRRHGRGVERGADAGGHRATDQGQLIVGQIGVHRHQRAFGRGHHVGESTERRERGERVSVDATGAWRVGQTERVLAEVRLAAHAIETVRTRGQARAHDSITDAHPAHGRADLDHPTGDFVAEDRRRRPRQVAAHDGYLGMAHAARGDGDHHIVGAGR